MRGSGGVLAHSTPAHSVYFKSFAPLLFLSKQPRPWSQSFSQAADAERDRLAHFPLLQWKQAWAVLWGGRCKGLGAACD